MDTPLKKKHPIVGENKQEIWGRKAIFYQVNHTRPTMPVYNVKNTNFLP
jgi:hypothetical protein